MHVLTQANVVVVVGFVGVVCLFVCFLKKGLIT